MFFEFQVNTAVKFLQNPKVSASPLHQKQEFLRRKGLTDKEIQRACDLASIGAQNGILPVRQMDYTSVPMYIQPPPAVWQNSLYLKIKEFFNATAIVGATLYCIYQLYKVIKNFEFYLDRISVIICEKFSTCRNLWNHSCLGKERKIRILWKSWIKIYRNL